MAEVENDESFFFSRFFFIFSYYSNDGTDQSTVYLIELFYNFDDGVFICTRRIRAFA